MRNRDFKCSPAGGARRLRERGLVTWLYPLRRADGLVLPAGTTYETLRRDGSVLDLCSIDLSRPYAIGHTVVNVHI